MRNLRSILVFHPALWGLVVLQSLVIAAWIAIDPKISFSLGHSADNFTVLGIAFLAAVTAYFLRAWRWPVVAERVRVMATSVIFLFVAFIGARFLNYLTMSLALPMADDRLDSWDKALGIDWHAYALRLSQHPDLLPYIQRPYAEAQFSILLIFLGLVAFGKIERAKEFATLLYLGVLLTVCIAGFFPADGAMARYMDSHFSEVFGPTAGVFFVATLQTVRESSNYVLDFSALPGLAAFPSFHTAIALLIVYALRDNVITFVMAVIAGGAILLATPVYGGHYFIDMFAGFLLTFVLAIAYAAVRRADLRPFWIATREALPLKARRSWETRPTES
jgi:hypothetical protein